MRISSSLMSCGALIAATCFSGAALAQADTQQTPVNQGHAYQQTNVPPGAIGGGYDPGTTRLNGAVAAADQHAATRNGYNQLGYHEAQAQYSADLSAYDAAMRAHGRRVARQDMHYMHQRQAYAAAMRDWRAQVYACHHGSMRACNAPAPDPATYY